jgi:hypothetical protein
MGANLRAILREAIETLDLQDPVAQRRLCDAVGLAYMAGAAWARADAVAQMVEQLPKEKPCPNCGETVPVVDDFLLRLLDPPEADPDDG